VQADRVSRTGIVIHPDDTLHIGDTGVVSLNGRRIGLVMLGGNVRFDSTAFESRGMGLIDPANM
jgi:hypothetical protein